MYTKRDKIEIFFHILTTNKKIRFFIWFILLMIIAFTFYRFIKEEKFSGDVYYYLFSSIIQGFLALIGVLGSVFIYKLQIIQNNLELTKNDAIQWIKYNINSSYNNYSWRSVRDEINFRLDNDKENLNLKRLSDSFIDFSEQLFLAKTELREFFAVSLVNVGVSIIFLLLSDSYISKDQYLLPSIFACFSVIFSLFLLYISFNVIIGLFGDVKRK